MQGPVPSPLFPREVVRSLGVVACCSDCSSIHNLYFFDYSDYYATLGLDFSSDSCCPHTDPVDIADFD